jgi:hypothetical protein
MGFVGALVGSSVGTSVGISVGSVAVGVLYRFNPYTNIGKAISPAIMIRFIKQITISSIKTP